MEHRQPDTDRAPDVSGETGTDLPRSGPAAGLLGWAVSVLLASGLGGALVAGAARAGAVPCPGSSADPCSGTGLLLAFQAGAGALVLALGALVLAWPSARSFTATMAFALLTVLLADLYAVPLLTLAESREGNVLSVLLLVAAVVLAHVCVLDAGDKATELVPALVALTAVFLLVDVVSLLWATALALWVVSAAASARRPAGRHAR